MENWLAQLIAFAIMGFIFWLIIKAEGFLRRTGVWSRLKEHRRVITFTFFFALIAFAVWVYIPSNQNPPHKPLNLEDYRLP